MALYILNQVPIASGTILTLYLRNPSDHYTRWGKSGDQRPFNGLIKEFKKEVGINFRTKANPGGEYLVDSADFSNFKDVGEYGMSYGIISAIPLHIQQKKRLNNKGELVCEPLKKYLLCSWAYSNIKFKEPEAKVNGKIMSTNILSHSLDWDVARFYKRSTSGESYYAHQNMVRMKACTNYNRTGYYLVGKEWKAS